jgi:CrcB protein
MLALAVGLAAAVGAVCRYLLDRLVSARHQATLPWGTLAVNVSGAFLLGLVTGLAVHHGLSPKAATVLGTGLLGGYTTWSTFTWESYALLSDGAVGAAALTVAATLVLGIAAAAAGLGLALL